MNKKEYDEPIPGFHCVEFQRKVREEGSELLQRDPEEYYRQVKQAMDDFMARRKIREEIEAKEK
jgi:hypothetical protein